MKTNNMIISEYESPKIEIILVEVEKGFASSQQMEADIDEMEWG